MLRLTLLRHAHASEPPPGGGDHDRPLSARGREAALQLGKRLPALLSMPDRLRVSPSIRTRQTAQLACSAAWPGLALEVADALYLATLDMLVDEIAMTPAACRHLMLVGHNPGLGDLWSLVGREAGFDGLAPGQWRSREFDVDAWPGVTAR